MTASTPDALDVEGVRKTFGKRPVLDGIDLRVAAGAAVVLRGPNGAGKSTLLSCIAGTLVPDAGRVRIGGHDLAEAPLAARGALRYLPQEVEVPAGISGRELLDLGATIFGADANDRRRAAEVTGLGDALERYAATYSVGMRRLLACGQLVLGRARLWVVDEPFAGVDADGRARVLAALLAAKADGAGIVIAAHDRDADEVAKLEPERFDLAPPPELDKEGS